jgi:hypothetical protein
MSIFDVGDKKIGYFHTPKCGSRTIVSWAVLIKEPELIEKQPTWFEESRRYVEYREIQKKLNPVSYKDFSIKFCVVRDPVDRFISMYTNRVLFHQTIKNFDCSIGVGEFIECFDDMIDTINFEGIKRHSLPLTHYLGTDATFYTHIFNINELDKLKILIEETYDVKLPNLHLQKSGNIQKPILTQEQTNWVKNKYKKDYEIYGKWF